MIPVYNFMDGNLKDFEYCPYSKATFNYWINTNPEETYKDVSTFVLPIVRHPLAKSFGWN